MTNINFAHRVKACFGAQQSSNTTVGHTRKRSSHQISDEYPMPAQRHPEQGARNNYCDAMALYKRQRTKLNLPGPPPETDDNRSTFQQLTHRTEANPNPNHKPDYIDHEYRDNAVEKMNEAYKKRSYKLPLDRHGLTSLPPTIEVFEFVEDFSLKFNCLESLPAQIGGMHALKFLNLTGNDLIKIPEELGKLKGLIQLDLRENPRLRNLPENIGNHARLTFLNADHCGIIDVPKSIGDCARLKTLSLSQNPLDVLPVDIGNFSQLQTLNLSYTNTSVFPESFNKVIEKSLLEINLAHTPFVGFSENLNDPTRLKSVNLIGTQVTTLPQAWGGFVYYGNKANKNIRQPKHIFSEQDLVIFSAQTKLTENMMQLGRLSNKHIRAEEYLEHCFVQDPVAAPTDHDAGSDDEGGKIGVRRQDGILSPPDDDVMILRAYRESIANTTTGRIGAWLEENDLDELVNAEELSEYPHIKHPDIRMGAVTPGYPPVAQAYVHMQQPYQAPSNNSSAALISTCGSLNLPWPDPDARRSTMQDSMIQIPTQAPMQQQAYMMQQPGMTQQPAFIINGQYTNTPPQYPQAPLSYATAQQDLGASTMPQFNQNQYGQYTQPPVIVPQTLQPQTNNATNIGNALNAASKIDISRWLAQFS
jgi:hypothetical protein